MSPAPPQTPGSTNGHYYVYDGTRDGKEAYLDIKTRKTNLNLPKKYDIEVHDVRAMDKKPTINTDNYELIPHFDTTVDSQAFLNDEKEAIEGTYFNEVQDIVKKITAAAEVHPYVYRIRNECKDVDDLSSGGSINATALPIAHADRDPENAFPRLVALFGQEKADELVKKYKHYAICNIWKPVTSVRKWPLLMVNHQAIPDWNYDTHIGKVVYGNQSSEQRYDRAPAKGHQSMLQYDDRYTYYYASDMEPDQAWIFYSFHTDPAKCAPHGAFWDNKTEKGAIDRVSVEVRTWAFFE